MDFAQLIERYDKSEVLTYLTSLNGQLVRPASDFDYHLHLTQLTQLVQALETPPKPKGKKDAAHVEAPVPSKLSANIVKLISRNMVIILGELSLKVFDIANGLLNHIQLDDTSDLSDIAQAAIVILIDLFEAFPNSLTSLINFSINQIFKILKKAPSVNSSLIYLLNSITKNSTKADIDEKLQSKLLKLYTKNISQSPISYELLTVDTDSSSTVLLKKNYILCLKNILLLGVSTNYENLLALSTSSTSSAGSKLKPEAIMAQQNQYQIALLATHEKLFQYGLSNYSKEVRVAMIELLANLFIGFVPTGKFNAIDYIISQYSLPALNCWDSSLSVSVDPENDSIFVDVRRDKNTLTSHDSESIIHGYTSTLLLQSSLVETLILYIQLEQFQNSEYLSSNLTYLLDSIFLKFGDLNQAVGHIQNQHWNKVLIHWTTLLDFIVEESGSSSHETLTSFVYSKFNLNEATESAPAPDTPQSALSRRSSQRDRKRESNLFSFKGKGGSKSSKAKDAKRKEIRPYHNHCHTHLLLHLVELLIPFGINFNSVAESKQENKVDSRAIEEEETEDSTQFEASFIKDILFKLIVNDESYIRNYSTKTLMLYAKENQVEINLLILQAFRMVNQEFKGSDKDRDSAQSSANICGQSATKLMSYSLVLSSLIKQTDSNLLQNSTLVKILSFCTQNLKQNNNNNHDNFLKNSACWVILSSLVTLYNESEFVKLNSSQFLVFWKSLLTSQFISTSMNATSQESQSKEIIENLKLRNFSLVCLLNYIKSVDFTPETLKQIQFLLTKSYNYITYLESNIEGVGAITNFQNTSFNENDYNPNLLNNIHFTNSSYNSKLSHERQIISLILYSKKVMLQCFTKLATVLKNDVNSNMVIFLMKVFSDSKTFCRISGSVTDKPKASKGKGSATKISDFDNEVLLFGEDYNYSFGVTSKLQGNSANIDELLIKSSYGPKKTDETGFLYSDAFTRRVEEAPKNAIESKIKSEFSTWTDFFEDLVFKSVDHSINYDPLVLLFESYSTHEHYSPSLVTSLVDLSIELFQLVFPYLSNQIQFSLLEQMRISITATSVDPLRAKAVEVNSTVALHGLLNNAIKKKLELDKDTVKTIIEIISKVTTKNKHLLLINADSIGLCNTLLPKTLLTDNLSKYVNDIVSDENPYKRGYSIIALAKISQKSKIGFNDVFNVATQLLSDPNPIVHYYALESLAILFDSNLDSTSYIPDALDKIYASYTDDSFGYETRNKVLVNLKCKYNSIGPLTELLKLFVTTSGPSLPEWPASEKSKLKNLITSLTLGIGLVTVNDYIEVYKNLLSLLSELIIFDSKLLDGEVSFFSDLLKLIISKNLKIGLASMSPTSLSKDAIFPFCTSFDLYKAAYECYVELIKIFGVDVLTKDTINMFWISMNLKPCDELKQFLTLWMESSLDMNWFVTLNSLFKFSSKKLTGPFIEVNYQQKLLPLSQRQKKKHTAQVDFKDEEIENIVGDDTDDDDKNEPITWEFKLFIFDLLNHLLDLSQKNPHLVEKLKSKIQDIVKVSFLGSTSPISEIKLRGISLLDKALSMFGHMADPLYPGVSILEQQQAQIISALIPCFNSTSDCKVIVNTINVSSKFINLPRIKFYSKQRILKTLIYLLEEISSNKFLKFGFLENASEYGRKSIQLSILNCWALLKIDAEGSNETEPELLETLDKYSVLLTSLWILVLREFSAVKFNSSSSRELEIYGNYWINFISILSIELESNTEFINKHLSGEAQNFFFVLFSQCVESLIKNKNVVEILTSLNRLVKSADLVDLLFQDDIFGEIIDLFDRLILIDNETDIQCELVEIVNTIFTTYYDSHNLETGFDKLFELIRVEMLPLFRILPFLRNDYDPDNQAQKLLLKHADSPANLLVLRKTMQKLVEMMSRFPDMVKVDLYSCLLFTFAKIYEYKNESLIAVVLPHLKQVILESSKFDVDIVGTFYNVIKGYYEIETTNNYSVMTTMVLMTSGNIKPNNDVSAKFATTLLKLLAADETAGVAVQCIKSLLHYSSRTNSQLLVIKHLLSNLIRMLSDEPESQLEPKLAFEILFLFSKLVTEDEKVVALYSVLIPLLIKYNDSDDISRSYLHERLLLLVKHSPHGFKAVVTTSLSDSQKQLAEELVKYSKASASTDSVNDQSEIQLKTFGGLEGGDAK